MKIDDYEGDPEFRSWLERVIEEKVREELLREREKQFRESFAIISIRPSCRLAAEIASHLGKSLVRHEIIVYGVASVGDNEDPDVSLANTCKVVSALHRTCKVSQINVVAPCLWYQAQDKTHARREPISVRDVAEDLIRRGMNHIIVVELHAEQIEIAFESFDHLKMAPIFADYISRRFRDAKDNLVLIAPDDGGVRTREELYKNLN